MLPHDHGADGCRRLQACRGVDDVTRDHGLTVGGAGVHGDDRLAGVDGDPYLQASVRSPVSNGERRSYRALRVVAVGRRRAEDAHHGVTHELLHDAAAPLDLGTNPLVVGSEDRADVLGVEALRLGSERDEVDEQDRHDPAFLADMAGLLEWSPAGE